MFGKPTVINNVETLTNVPVIIEKGADWYRKFGTEKSPGVKIFSLSGNVNKPGNYELPLGTTFRELIYTHGGGLKPGRKVKAILPGGASSIVIKATPKALDTPMDYESVASLGSALGSASVIVVDDSVSMLWVTKKIIHFFRHESCGKCTPCREGTYWMDQILHHAKSGQTELPGSGIDQECSRSDQEQVSLPAGRVFHHGPGIIHRTIPRGLSELTHAEADLANHRQHAGQCNGKHADRGCCQACRHRYSRILLSSQDEAGWHVPAMSG